MKKLLIGSLLLVLALGGLGKLGYAADPAPAASDIGPNRLVDGVSLTDFQAIQKILLESAAADKDIAIIDAQMTALRAQRMELSFKAAARDHPELVQKLKVVLDSRRERLKQEQTTAREAARLLKKQGN